MSEFNPHNQPNPERYVAGMREVTLRGREEGAESRLALDPDNPLYTRNKAIELFQTNGTVLATIELPMPKSDGKNREFAIVDFGKFGEDNAPAVFAMPGHEVSGMGSAEARFGIIEVDHEIDEVDGPMFPRYAFLKNASTTIGRNEGGINHKLGLSWDDMPNQNVSREHLTINVADDHLELIDHSMNGTVVRYHEQP